MILDVFICCYLYLAVNQNNPKLSEASVHHNILHFTHTKTTILKISNGSNTSVARALTPLSPSPLRVSVPVLPFRSTSRREEQQLHGVWPKWTTAAPLRTEAARTRLPSLLCGRPAAPRCAPGTRFDVGKVG